MNISNITLFQLMAYLILALGLLAIVLSPYIKILSTGPLSKPLVRLVIVIIIIITVFYLRD